MKQVNLTITFDEEKLSALKRYMGKKELDLDREMTDALVKLYEKYVPAPVREYIDESDVSAAAPSKPRRSPRAAAPRTPDFCWGWTSRWMSWQTAGLRRMVWMPPMVRSCSTASGRFGRNCLMTQAHARFVISWPPMLAASFP